MNLSFRELLKREGPLIFDGAMGTNLSERGLSGNSPFEKLNLSYPEIVKEINTSFVRLGVDVIETNTFGASRIKLGRYGISNLTEAINREGVRIAKEATSSSCLVGASVGPLGVLLKPWGTLTPEEASLAFEEQIRRVAIEGADLIVIETMMDVEEAKLAISAAKRVCKLPVVCQFTFGKEGKTLMGLDPSAIVEAMKDTEIDALGANCSSGPESLFPVAEKMRSLSSFPLIFQPNAGEPILKGEKTIFPVSPEDMADWMEKYVNIGIKIVGGCCGNTPLHIKAIIERIGGRG
ncbi:MAG: homocysteine S-methyltransferase family protein [Candidatus Aerophobetes bacterium]|nr:homocysteine S-methyltransferase family protein [Candidatus Aerophobetes bacterium]